MTTIDRVRTYDHIDHRVAEDRVRARSVSGSFYRICDLVHTRIGYRISARIDASINEAP